MAARPATQWGNDLAIHKKKSCVFDDFYTLEPVSAFEVFGAVG